MTSRSEHPVDTEPKTTDPVIPKATSLLINTGNIVSADRLKKRSTTTSQDEVGHKKISIYNLNFFR